MYKKIYIKRYERGLLFRRGDFVRPLAPGTYRVWIWNALRDRIEVVSTLKTYFEHPLLEVLLRDDRLREQLVIVDNTATERALVWKDGRLLHFLGAGRFAYWATPARIEVERFDVSQFRFQHPKVQLVLDNPDAAKYFEGVQVEPNEDVLLYRDGVLIGRLSEGLHVFFKGTGKVRWKAIDRREQVADVAGQEIMTSDKVTLRVNLIVTYLVTDILRATQASADYAQALYREAQLILRAAVGGKTLDQLLADKESVGGEVRNALIPRAEQLGVTVKSVGLRDIILPGDMRVLLNQVVAAQKEAEANLIKRREETAAARSQVNTAKLLAENPLLARMKELELLKDVLADTNATFVLGQGDLTEQLRGLIAQKSVVEPKA